MRACVDSAKAGAYDIAVPRDFTAKAAGQLLNIILLGLVSFFSDISSEMVYPVIPLYLTARLGATPALVGVIEGIAESTASLLKVFSGYFTDRFSHKKPVAMLGYSGGLFYKAALILSASWPGVLTARVIDRAGKGIRTAPRDVMIGESAGAGRIGRAFGIHKALDMAGSAIGIFISYLLLKHSETMAEVFDYKKLFLISAIPAVLGLAMFIFIKEKRATTGREREPFWKNIKQLDGRLKLYLCVFFLFTLGNSSNAFLLLKAKNAGFNDTNVVLLYFVYNLVSSLLAVPLGRLSDAIGRKKLLVAGYFVFSAVYACFAFAGSRPALYFAFALYGIYTAMTAGVERAFITEIAPAALKGTLLGLHSTLAGIALLPASVMAGLLWDAAGPKAPFLTGSALSLAAALVLLFFLKGANTGSEEPAQAAVAGE